MQPISRDLTSLTSSRAIYWKGGLFCGIAILAAAILIARTPSWEVAVLLATCVWASCRAYYFAFYVIEHYVDSTYRFRGLIDFVAYTMNIRREENRGDDETEKFVNPLPGLQPDLSRKEDVQFRVTSTAQRER